MKVPTHTFAEMLYKVYEILGLFKKNTNRRDLRNHSNFSSHQVFFAKALDEIIDTIDNQESLDKQIRLVLFYKYEQLYNKFVSTNLVSTLNAKEIMIRFTEIVIPAVIALDIHITLRGYRKEDPFNFYYHIRKFLLSEKYNKNNEELIYQNAKKYLKKYIKSLSFEPFIDLSSIISLIDNIRKSSKQRTASINTAIDQCLSIANLMGYKKSYKFDLLRVAYTSINTLLLFQKETNLLDSVYNNYEKIIKKEIKEYEPISKLKNYLYDGKNHLIILGIEDEIVDKNSTEVINSIISYLDIPILNNPNVKDIIYEIERFTFNLDYLVPYSKSYFNLLKRHLNKYDKNNILKPYLTFIDIILLLQDEKIDAAFNFIKNINKKNLPLGFLNSAISTIDLALQIKLKKKTIRNGSLIPLINSILITNSIYIKYYPIAYHIENNKIRENPIIKNPNNIILMQSIARYNLMISKITDEKNYKFDEVFPHAINGSLNHLDKLLEKLIKHVLNFNIKDDVIAKKIIEKKIYTYSNLNKNLINILNDCSLYNCIGCLSILYDYLQAPGEEFENIRLFISKPEKEINNLRKALHIAENILYENKQKKKSAVLDN